MTYLEHAIRDFDNIPDERKKQLKKMALFIQTKIKAGEEARLIFICTHNSRRSHMSQLWARVAADYYGVPQVHTFSGGTEATAFNPRAVVALERAGFAIKPVSEGENPHYQVSYSPDAPVQEAFSKKYDDAANPQQNFAAIMTCSQADKNCPFVPGATLRIAIPYDDPKEADGTPQEAARYDERSQQIATEMMYCFAQIQGKE
ncbi:MAG: protein-tyrosine-phosphatase [Tunicatimonas sp.]